MFDYKQRAATEEYRNNYDKIFNINICKCKEKPLITLWDKKLGQICSKCKKIIITP